MTTLKIYSDTWNIYLSRKVKIYLKQHNLYASEAAGTPTCTTVWQPPGACVCQSGHPPLPVQAGSRSEVACAHNSLAWSTRPSRLLFSLPNSATPRGTYGEVDAGWGRGAIAFLLWSPAKEDSLLRALGRTWSLSLPRPRHPASPAASVPTQLIFLPLGTARFIAVTAPTLGYGNGTQR
jgi:hypothetical protein